MRSRPDIISEQEKAIIEARLDEYDRNPEVGSSWEEAKARILAGLHTVRASESGTVVWIDPKKLHRALLNLIKNACEVLNSEERRHGSR